MTASPDTTETDLVAIERTLEPSEGGLVATVTVRSPSGAPLVVRFSDPIGQWSGAESIRVHPETEPERWTIDGSSLVAELLVAPDEPSTVTYDLRGADGNSDPDPVTVDQAQPTDHETLTTGQVPRFRDTQVFEGQGMDTQPSVMESEATDADVRRAVEAISTSRSTPSEQALPDNRPDPLDLAEPDDA